MKSNLYILFIGRLIYPFDLVHEEESILLHTIYVRYFIPPELRHIIFEYKGTIDELKLYQYVACRLFNVRNIDSLMPQTNMNSISFTTYLIGKQRITLYKSQDNDAKFIHSNMRKLISHVTLKRENVVNFDPDRFSFIIKRCHEKLKENTFISFAPLSCIYDGNVSKIGLKYGWTYNLNKNN
jgi:hypothetical protein